MKKVLAISVMAFLHAGLHAEEPSDILAQFVSLSASAADSCKDISGGINKIKTFAGIGIGTGVVGTVSGGIATASGFAKSKIDKEVVAKIAGLSSVKNEDEVNKAIINQEFSAAAKDIAALGDIKSIDKNAPAAISQKLGNIRTIGSGVSGVANVSGAVVSFLGVRDFDDLISDMDKCSDKVKEIDDLKSRAEVESPDDTATIEQMQNIVNSCKGLDSGNIKDVKTRMVAAGIVSSVGGVVGVTGALLSASAVKKEKADPGLAVKSKAEGGTKGLNTAANVMAAGTTVASISGAVLSGLTLSGLNKNSDIAENCAGAF